MAPGHSAPAAAPSPRRDDEDAPRLAGRCLNGAAEMERRQIGHHAGRKGDEAFHTRPVIDEEDGHARWHRDRAGQPHRLEEGCMGAAATILRKALERRGVLEQGRSSTDSGTRPDGRAPPSALQHDRRQAGASTTRTGTMRRRRSTPRQSPANKEHDDRLLPPLRLAGTIRRGMVEGQAVTAAETAALRDKLGAHAQDAGAKVP